MPDYAPPNPKNKRRPYSCPKCKAEIRLVTTFTGYDSEDIDPKTGEWVEDSEVYTERSEVHNMEWSCSKCKWEGDVEEAQSNEA